jgi:hypothetical protein
MTRNRKGRAGWHQATLITSKHSCNFISLVARVKGFIVTLALWGFLPIDLANQLINLGGQSDV